MSDRTRAWMYALILFTILGTIGCGAPKAASTGPALKIDSYTTAQGLPHNHITSLAVFAGKIWAGTKAGLVGHDGVNWQVIVRKVNNALGSDLIEALTVADNILYVATDNGVSKYTGETWNTVMTGSRARGVAARSPEIAAATAHGIEHSTGGAFTAYDKEKAGLIYDEVNTVAFDGQGKLWVGTRSGMALYSNGTFQNYTGPAKTVMGNSLVDVPPSPSTCQLPGNNINVILPWKGQIVVGTTSGLAITDMDRSWRIFSAPHREWAQRGNQIVEEMNAGNCPMPGNVVNALAAYSDAVLFVGTNKGLAALKDSTWIDLAKQIPQVATKSITALTVDKDNLWVGTPEGLFKVSGISALAAPGNAN